MLLSSARRAANGIETPMELHYSQTCVFHSPFYSPFETPMELHYSQTSASSRCFELMFETPMELHYSQT